MVLLSLPLTLAVFIGVMWLASEINAEYVKPDRSFALERWRDGIHE